MQSHSRFRFALVTGQAHLSHRAYWHEGKLYYRGKVVIDKSEPEKA